jgi:hypothetical protein
MNFLCDFSYGNYGCFFEWSCQIRRMLESFWYKFDPQFLNQFSSNSVQIDQPKVIIWRIHMCSFMRHVTCGTSIKPHNFSYLQSFDLKTLPTIPWNCTFVFKIELKSLRIWKVMRFYTCAARDMSHRTAHIFDDFCLADFKI